MRNCAVSFVGASGVKHSAEVQAESLFEAAVADIRAISEQCGQKSAVAHQLTLEQIRPWLESTSASPKDAVMMQRLKERLSNAG